MSNNMSVDPVFRNVAGNMTGFHVWRIENMQVVPIPSEAWGKFFTGDAYIVLSSAPHGSRYHDCLGKLISHDNVFQFILYIQLSVVVCLSSHLFTMEELSNISTSGWEKRHQQMR